MLDTPAENGAFLAREIPPETLDLLLSKGWRHFGEQFYYYKKVFGEDLHHVRPLRIVLAEFHRSKSQRRTWNRNADLSITLRPLSPSPEIDTLFHLHKKRFHDNVPDSLSAFLGDDLPNSPTDTRQLEVRLGDRLLACSFLDIGATSASSIYALFHPAESRRRLGILTILLELEWCAQNGIDLYYPGYAYLEPSHYDYKKQFRGTESYDWKTWTKLPLAVTSGRPANPPS